MTTIFHTISDFKLATLEGSPITTRFCCQEAVVASWINLMQNCSNSDIGSVSMAGETTTISKTLFGDTTSVFFPFCNKVCAEENYTFIFERTCSGLSDRFSILLSSFLLMANSDSDLFIPFGQTVTLSGFAEILSDIVYEWTGNTPSDFIGSTDSYEAVIRPCGPGDKTYTVVGYASDFPNCRASTTFNVNVGTPVIYWSDVQQSDTGSDWVLSAWLFHSNTYVDDFTIKLTSVTQKSDILEIFESPCPNPYFFTQHVKRPFAGTFNKYDLNATLSDFYSCPYANASCSFVCGKTYLTHHPLWMFFAIGFGIFLVFIIMIFI